jgi:hypothetical protein
MEIMSPTNPNVIGILEVGGEEMTRTEPGKSQTSEIVLRESSFTIVEGRGESLAIRPCLIVE